jgi:hypothetical protein
MAFFGVILLSNERQMAVWDPSAFNNVRTTMVKQWCRIVKLLPFDNLFKFQGTLATRTPYREQASFLGFTLLACCIGFQRIRGEPVFRGC